MRRLRTDPHYGFHMRRWHVDRRWVLATLSKTWYDVEERATERTVVAEAWVDVTGMNERECVLACLAEVAAGYSDDIA